MKYKLEITRAIIDRGEVEIEADSLTEAKRKYFSPAMDEPMIFDDEIDWKEVKTLYYVNGDYIETFNGPQDAGTDFVIQEDLLKED